MFQMSHWIFHCTESFDKDSTWLREFPLIFSKMADRHRVAGFSPLAAQWREISQMCKPFLGSLYKVLLLNDLFDRL